MTEADAASECRRCAGTGRDRDLFGDPMPLVMPDPDGGRGPCRDCQPEASIRWMTASLGLRPGPFPAAGDSTWQIVATLVHNVEELRRGLAKVAERGWVSNGSRHRWAATGGPAGYCQGCGVAYTTWGGDDCGSARTTAMTDASGIMAWLVKQFDEDEYAALVATPGPWMDYGGRFSIGVEQVCGTDGHMVAEMQVCTDLGHDDRRIEDARFVADWNPARVLADLAAKRRILDRHGPHPHYQGCCKADAGIESCGCVGGGSESEWPCATVRDLASAYAHRPGYRSEWAPA